MESNRVIVVGRLLGDLKAHHNSYRTFFDGTIAVQRLSGTMDLLPVVIPDDVSVRCGFDKPWEMGDRTFRMEGVIKTYNRSDGGRKRHYVVLHVAKIEEANDHSPANSVHLVGKICKPPEFRETPLGREICDFMVAVNYNRWKSAFIPCIAWGMTARKVSKLEVGQVVELDGRFQSREYVKTLENGEQETRTAYEVSAKTVCTHEVKKRLIIEPEKEKCILKEE